MSKLIQIREFSLQRYLKIDPENMASLGLSEREWSICSHVAYWAKIEARGFIEITRKELGKLYNLSVWRMKHVIAHLVERGFLEKVSHRFLKPTKRWLDIENSNGLALHKKLLEDPRLSTLEIFEGTLDEDETPEDKDETPEDKDETPTPTIEVLDVASGNMIEVEEENPEKDIESSLETAPSLNIVKSKAKQFAEKVGITIEDATESGESFWFYHERLSWRVSKWQTSLFHFMISWKKQKQFFKQEDEKKDKRIYKPTNHEEMRLFLKQLPDEIRTKIKTKRKGDGALIVVNMIGMPVEADTRLHCSDSFVEKFFEYWLKDGNWKGLKC